MKLLNGTIIDLPPKTELKLLCKLIREEGFKINNIPHTQIYKLGKYYTRNLLKKQTNLPII